MSVSDIVMAIRSSMDDFHTDGKVQSPKIQTFACRGFLAACHKRERRDVTKVDSSTFHTLKTWRVHRTFVLSPPLSKPLSSAESADTPFQSRLCDCIDRSIWRHKATIKRFSSWISSEPMLGALDSIKKLFKWNRDVLPFRGESKLKIRTSCNGSEVYALFRTTKLLHCPMIRIGSCLGAGSCWSAYSCLVSISGMLFLLDTLGQCLRHSAARFKVLMELAKVPQHAILQTKWQPFSVSASLTGL